MVAVISVPFLTRFPILKRDVPFLS
jgi:hypothetical protein